MLLSGVYFEFISDILLEGICLLIWHSHRTDIKIHRKSEIYRSILLPISCKPFGGIIIILVEKICM